jgi:hypothetical protein
MDIGKSLGFVFEDKKWVEKMLIGGLISLVPIIGAFWVMGYGVKLVRNVRNGDPEPLPEWENFGDLLSDGFKLFVIYFVWAIPLIISYFPTLLPAILAQDAGGDTSAALGIVSACFGCLMTLYGLFYAVISPALMVKFADIGEISAGLDFKGILDFVKKNLGQIVLVVIVGIAVSLIAQLVGLILCLIGIVFTLFWARIVMAHMIAQIDKDDRPQEQDVFKPATPLETLPENSDDDSGHSIIS